ncbi:hypothetical protein J4218_01765 [Candidatus Pacearchaeota archaeon]|nr:hypothetical protein [uncultured archaeon]MBS3078825.1 hypothetical protein [Candidatus Pacearchaeota archaeon]
MKNKAIFVSFVAFLAIALILNTVLASDIVTITSVKVNGVVASQTSPAIAGEVSDTVPVEVEFLANADVTDARVKVSIEGYKEDISASTPRFLLVNGSRYVKRFTLQLPSSMDLDDLTEGVELQVEVSAKAEASVVQSYAIKMQRDLYSLNILSVDAPQKVTAGNTVAFDIVLQNNGNDRLDNTYIKVSIPELGVERKVYFGDLSPYVEDNYEDIRDTNNKVLYLAIPRNAQPGNYNVVIEAYNYDTSTIVKERLVVESAGSQSGVIPSITSRTISTGEETTFEVVLVNPNDRMVVYSIIPEQSEGLIVNVQEPVVTVGADSSRTVVVKVKATNSASEGTHLVVVGVNTESGLERKVSFTVNVDNNSSTNPVPGLTGNNTVLILTVILVIVFVVLLVILIVLLTRKPTETEEFGETSYY